MLMVSEAIHCHSTTAILLFTFLPFYLFTFLPLPDHLWGTGFQVSIDICRALNYLYIYHQKSGVILKKKRLGRK